MSHEQTYITKEGLDKLKLELEDLIKVKRKEVIAKIERSGTLLRTLKISSLTLSFGGINALVLTANTFISPFYG